MKLLIVGYLLACVLNFLVFSPAVQLPVGFWSASALSAGLLGVVAWYAERDDRARLFWYENRWLPIGLAAALVLYVVTAAGDSLLSPVFAFARHGIDAIYAYGRGTSRILIGTLLLFWFAPLEELFWRGFVQHRLMQRFGDTAGWLAATGASLVAHLWAWNPVLWLALIAGGLLWGWLFMRYRRLWPCIIAHAVWDVLVFIILPLRQP